jgi:hypothetical protein
MRAVNGMRTVRLTTTMLSAARGPARRGQEPRTADSPYADTAA